MLTALTHQPSPALQDCELTFLPHQKIDLALASRQHRDYCTMLKNCGAEIITLHDNLTLPDSVFVEDPVVVFDEIAIMTSMGVASRRRETAAIESFFRSYRQTQRICLPAKLEGGDVLQIGKTVYVGLSSRTNGQGIAALRRIMKPLGYQIIPVTVRGCLHLKTGCTALDTNTILAHPEWLDLSPFQNLEIIRIPVEEPFGANILPIHDTICMNRAFPKTEQLVRDLGYKVISTDISEFVKAEAGLTCMSVLFNMNP